MRIEVDIIDAGFRFSAESASYANERVKIATMLIKKAKYLLADSREYTPEANDLRRGIDNLLRVAP